MGASALNAAVTSNTPAHVALVANLIDPPVRAARMHMEIMCRGYSCSFREGKNEMWDVREEGMHSKCVRSLMHVDHKILSRDGRCDCHICSVCTNVGHTIGYKGDSPGAPATPDTNIGAHRPVNDVPWLLFARVVLCPLECVQLLVSALLMRCDGGAFE